MRRRHLGIDNRRAGAPHTRTQVRRPGIQASIGSLAALVISGLLIGCSAGNGEGLDQNGRPLGETPDDTGPPAAAASFAKIQQDIFDPLCIVCHAGAAAPVGLKLDSISSFSSLVNVPSVEVPSLLRVAPGDPDASYLLQKIAGTAAVGARMPLGEAPVSPSLVAELRQWISDGALPQTPPSGTPTVPAVVAVVPQGGSILMSAPQSVTVVFNVPMDFSLAGAETVRLTAAGADGQIDTADDVVVTPASILPNNPQSLVIDLSGALLPDDEYWLTLAGSGLLFLTSLDGTALDGDGDGQPGGNFTSGFTVSAVAVQPQASWRWLQDNVFTPICTQCHAAGGIAEFLLLDEANSYGAMVNQASLEVGSLLLVAPNDADNSYLVQKVEGTAAVGDRMPLGLSPLDDAVIGAMRAWINSGAPLEPGDPMPDNVSPQVSLASPGSPLAGTVQVAVAALDNVGVVSVSLYVDDSLLTSDATTPFEFSLDTTTLADGSHSLRAEAVDAAGNVGQSAEIFVEVDNSPPPDVQAPGASISVPSGTLAGLVTVAVVASDNVGVETVDLFIDDVLFDSDQVEPYEFSWDTVAVANGMHTLHAVATDAAGNVGVSADITVTVDNTAPPDLQAPNVVITAPLSPASGTVNVAVTATDNVGVVSVDLLVDDVVIATDAAAPFEFVWDTTLFDNGDRVLSARASDAAGNLGVAPAVTVTLANAPPPDTTRPVVSIAAPAGLVSTTVEVTVDAVDDVEIGSVSLFADGVQIGQLTIAPYVFTWDVSALADGAHLLFASAVDVAGNAGYADPLAVEVQNGTPQATLPWIQQNIFSVGCAVGCHTSGGIAAFLWLTDGDSFGQLVNIESTRGGPDFRVLPGDPDESALVQRLEGDVSPQMPLGAPPLPPQQIQAVRDWIGSGALEFPADTIAPAAVLRLPDGPAMGTVTLAAVAIDDVGIVDVRFLVDGVVVGSDTVAPFEVVFDSTGVADGDRLVVVEAEDAAGNTGASPAQVLAVANN